MNFRRINSFENDKNVGIRSVKGEISKRKRRSEETDETLVTFYSVRDVMATKGNLTTRVITMWIVLGALCAASFTTANYLIETLNLKPEEIDPIANPMKTKGHRFREIKMQIFGDQHEDELSIQQFKALDWLANRDGLKLPVNATNLLQRYTLALFYYSTNEEGWTRQLKWLSNSHECEWRDDGGVRGCTKNLEVTDLSIWNNLKGKIPQELFLLSELKILYLARNKLYGTLPTEIGLLNKLEYLGLHHNQLKGTLPTSYMGKLSNLKAIYLEKNQFSGVIPKGDPICQLRRENKASKKNLETGIGQLTRFTADCKSLVTWRQPKISCECCTKCYL
jgi:Leucine rich repeat